MTQYLYTPVAAQPDNTARLFTMYDTVSAFSDIVTPGYLEDQQKLGHVFYNTDFFLVKYTDGAGLFNVVLDGNGIASLTPTGETSNDVIAGSNGVSGYLATYSATKNKGYFKLQSVANTGNTVFTLNNTVMGQTSTVSICDPAAAQGYIPVSTVNASDTPVGCFIRQSVQIRASDLASAGQKIIQAAGTGMIFLIHDIKFSFSIGLSGGGGNRLLQITDGTTVYNNAGVTAALLGTPINTVWGGTGNPLPSTNSVSFLVPTQAGASIYATYAGGTTDYTTGSVIMAFLLERLA